MFLNSNPCQKTQPIVVFLNPKTPNYLKNRSLGIRILPDLEKSKLNLNLIDDAPSFDIVPWKLSVPTVRIDLASFIKNIQQTQKYINSSIYNLSLNTLCQKMFSPTVLKQRKELLRWLYPQNELKNLLHVGFQTTVQYIQQSWGLFF